MNLSMDTSSIYLQSSTFIVTTQIHVNQLKHYLPWFQWFVLGRFVLPKRVIIIIIIINYNFKCFMV